jgi:hypothetical protein
MVVGKDRRGGARGVNRVLVVLIALIAGVATAAGSRCLGLGNLGPIRTGMTVDEVLPLADFSGMERRRPVEECWYLHHAGPGNAFDLMIIGGRVVRIEIKGVSALHTVSGARIGTTETELKMLYGSRLEVQPHKYDAKGKTLTFKATGGEYGLRFETSSGKVTAIQSGPWEHLHYVEGCG